MSAGHPENDRRAAARARFIASFGHPPLIDFDTLSDAALDAEIDMLAEIENDTYSPCTPSRHMFLETD